MRSPWYKRIVGLCSVVILLLAVATPGSTQTKLIYMAADTARAESVPSNATPRPQEAISVAINVDVSALQAPNNRLAAYQATLNWDPTVIQFVSVTPAPAPWETPNLNTNDVANGNLEWNDFVAGGTTGDINLLNLNFNVVGAPGSSTILDLNFAEMTTSTFVSILNVLKTTDGTVTVRDNAPPVLAAIGDQMMNENTTLNVAVSATDPDNDKITFQALNLPAFGSLTDNNNNTATIRFTPGFDAAGVYPAIAVIAIDNFVPAKSDTTFFTLTVNDVNRPPVLAAIADQTMNENATLDVAISATDPDNGKITFLALNLPAFGNLVDNNNNTATIRFTPGFDAAGVYPAIVVVATDDGTPAKSDTTLFTLTVNDVNRPPVLAAIADQTMNEGATLNVAISVADPDSGKITFQALNLPAFGNLIDNTNNTATIRFTPGFDAAGVYPAITVIATDNGSPAKSDTASFTLTVQNINRPPVIAQLTPPGTVIVLNEGKRAEFPLSATDPDSDQIALRGENLPSFATVIDSGNGRGRLILTPGREDAGDFPNILVIATDNGVPPLSDSTGLKLKVIDVFPTLVCDIEIVKPKDGATVCGDSLEVCVNTTVTGTVGPTITTTTVNGVPVLSGCANIPLVNGANEIIAVVTVKDSLSTCVSSDTITVFGGQLATKCELTITSPLDSAKVFCSDSLEVKGTISNTGGVPLNIVCEVNGAPAVVTGNAFSAQVNLNAGWNTLIATATLTDSCGNLVVCRDTVRVRQVIEKIAPTCTFERQSPTRVAGTLFDHESGIAKIEPLLLNNVTLTVDPFQPGDKQVNFRVDAIDEDEAMGFDIKITDLCGNTHICDPVALQLTADRANRPYIFTFRTVDRYFHLTNSGLSEIRVELNGKHFSLSSAYRGGVVQSLGVYAMPRQGEVMIDLQPYLHRDRDNDIRIEVSGPAGSKADLLIVDDLNEASEVLALQQMPVEYELTQNYPNPFNPETIIRFGIPAHVTAGARVQLRIYSALGELVRTLVDQDMLPGRYTARWNGRNERGVPVAAGVYIYRLVAGKYSATKRMLLLK